MKRETRDVGPVKGLVMGSVQSGKTANMIGLVSMAADYDWNFFIIMSGSIDNLRKQTRDRFCADLMQSQGVNWRVLDYTSNPDYLIDIKTAKPNKSQGKSHSSKVWLHIKFILVYNMMREKERNILKFITAFVLLFKKER